MTAPKTVLNLIERFEQQLDSYKAGDYKEASLRREFLDPFFKALGWDIDNEQGYAEAYKDVVHEDTLRIGGAVKAPDYGFRIGGVRKFFLEAKKPSVVVKEDISASYQLRRYAWSAKLPLSILSDFEEFAVYDCRVRPNPTDKAATARVFYCTFREYAEKWDWLYATFSREAILKGSFDKYAETNKGKRGTAEVDADFLRTIEGWRSELARNLAIRNAALTQRELNFAVQRIIDRIIFLRICEDRGIEDYGRLLALSNGGDIYKRMGMIFREADSRYNSGLFHFKAERDAAEPPDEITLALAIDDKLLRDMLKSLYFPDSPYEFSVLPADILGHVYEQFLGKVIRLTDGHRAVVEEKPEVRKAGGVYYTPTYIVEYIVKETVGKLTEGKTPGEIAKMRILDPACGSGSFLIGAYQYLLDRHFAWYLENDPEKWAKGKKPALVKTMAGWKLTVAERKRILLNNIYGVDIDSQAVEVTKLSLLLKVLEGETEQSVQTMMNLFRERALPDLGSNIKCGNSLIGPDFYAQAALPDMNDEERLRVNVFDWQAEFPAIFKAGGFDAVIGNPPYRMLQPNNTEKPLLDYLKNRYVAAEFKIEFFHLFLQRGIELLKTAGYHGYIVPTTILNNVYAANLRSWLLDQCAIESIAVAQHRVFATADVHTSVLIFQKEPDGKRRSRHLVKTSTDLSIDFTRSPFFGASVLQNRFHELPGNVWNILITEKNAEFLKRLTTSFAQLGNIAKINRGLITGDRGSYFATKQATSKHVPILAGGDIYRYHFSQPSEFVLFERPKTAGGCWDREVHLAPHKIAVRQIGAGPTATWINKPIAVTGNIFTVRGTDKEHELFLLGILNSKLVDYFWRVMFADFKGSFPQVTIFSLEQVPVREIDQKKKSDREAHGKMVKLVEQALSLHEQAAAARTPQEKTAIDRQISATDAQIDRLVYDLYALTEEEIKIVEGASEKK